MKEAEGELRGASGESGIFQKQVKKVCQGGERSQCCQMPLMHQGR